MKYIQPCVLNNKHLHSQSISEDNLENSNAEQVKNSELRQGELEVIAGGCETISCDDGRFAGYVNHNETMVSLAE